MLYVSAVISIVVTGFFAWLNLRDGFPFSLTEAVILGILSTIGFYLYIYFTKIYFRWCHLFLGTSFALFGFIVSMYIHFDYLSNQGYHQYYVFTSAKYLHYGNGFLPFLNQLFLEGFVFLLSSTIVALVILGTILRCKDCKNGVLKETLLFASSDYSNDVRKFIKLSSEEDTIGLISYIKEQRLLTGFFSRKKNVSSICFYLLTCNHCGNQHIVSKKLREFNDDGVKKKTHNIIVKVGSKSEIRV